MKLASFVAIISLMMLYSNGFAGNRMNIIPEPNSILQNEGSFQLSRKTIIQSTSALRSLSDYLASQLKFFTGISLKVVTYSKRSRPNSMVLEIISASKATNPEAYTLDIAPNKVVLKARTQEGLFRGIQSLLQLVPLKGTNGVGDISIPACLIKDAPRFAWRGLNLDCVRHFMTINFIKRYINLLAYYKFNVFHWHLTDDQGWRIQIKKYPKLTEIGAWRNEGNGEKYGGYYTQKEIKDVVAYAKSRFITVVPEIEMPGHCQASLAAYPENACVPGPFQVGTQWGVYTNIYNPAKRSTYPFLENVLTEVMRLFPSHYIHIGGDEVPKTEWIQNTLCQELMKEKNLQNVDQLQSYFIRKIQAFLKSHGRQIIGWNEILEGDGPATGAVVQSWQGIDGAITAVKKGLYTIDSPSNYTYLSSSPSDLPLDSVYSFNPIPPGLTHSQKKLVLGTEASMWTERAPQDDVDSKMFPRLLAISEDAWTDPQKKNYSDFHKRVKEEYSRLAYLGVDYGLEQRAMAYNSEFDKLEKRFVVSIQPTQPGVKLRYTIGDTLTIENSHLYQKPVTIDTTNTFIGQAEINGRLVGNPVKLSFMIDEALDSKVTLKYPYSPEYTGGGPEGLVNGIRGTSNFRDGLWQGFKGDDLDATVKLKGKTKISQIGAGFLQSSSSYIFMPSSVTFYVSKDGKDFRRVGLVENYVSEKNPDNIRKDFVVHFRPRDVRYFRIVAKNIGVCPPWHPGAGAKAWVFVDELFAN